MTLIEPYVLDVSRYQALPENVPPIHMDWGKAYDAGARVAFIRWTVGNYYKDIEREEHWKRAKDAGLLCSPYLVVAPEYTADSHIAWFKNLFKYKSDLPIVIDCELDRGQNQQKITTCIQKICGEISAWDGRKVIIYTRRTWWNPFVLPWSGWSQYPLFEAWYTNTLAKPNFTTRAKNFIIRMRYGSTMTLYSRDWMDAHIPWTLWQYSADGNMMGGKYGSPSKSIDLSRYNGTPEQFDAKFGTNISGTGGTIPPTELTDKEKLDILWREAQKAGWDVAK